MFKTFDSKSTPRFDRVARKIERQERIELHNQRESARNSTPEQVTVNGVIIRIRK